MKNLFEKILNTMESYVNQNIKIREEISKIQGNGDYSAAKKEIDVNSKKQELQQLSENCLNDVNSIVDGIIGKLNNVNAACNIADLQGVFAYITASGSKCNVNVLLNQIKAYAGNLTAIQAILDVAENSGVNETCKRCIKGFIYTPEEIENELKENAQLVFVGAKSATEFGKTIESIAAKLGVNVVSNIKDEFTDNQLLRKAFGLV